MSYLVRAAAAVSLLTLIPVGQASAVRPPVAADPRALTFVLAGQSNMAGQGIKDGRTHVTPAVTVLTPDRGWVEATDPLPIPVHPDGWTVGGGVGPGIAFADKLIARGVTDEVRLISCSVSNTPIRDWVPGGEWFDACAAQISRADDHVDGVLYYQGENDSIDRATALAWPSNFARFVAGMRQIVPGVSVVFAQLGPDVPSVARFHPWWNTVKSEQAAVRLRDVRMIRTDDLPVRSDQPIHHTARAEREIGRRFAYAWLKLRRG